MCFAFKPEMFVELLDKTSIILLKFQDSSFINKEQRMASLAYLRRYWLQDPV